MLDEDDKSDRNWHSEADSEVAAKYDANEQLFMGAPGGSANHTENNATTAENGNHMKEKQNILSNHKGHEMASKMVTTSVSH